MQSLALSFKLAIFGASEFSKLTNKHWLDCFVSGGIASRVAKSTNSSWEHQPNVALQLPDEPDVQKSFPVDDKSGIHMMQAFN
jgi:hypothetical protein